ncbi:MAG: DUF790 family protein [Pirellulaceae bacterium]|nr:DUF790 family protein [Pirellulaceae bacterium]
MLTRELAIVVYEGSRAHPDRLTVKKHSHYVDYARRMADVYARGVGRTRNEIHRDVHAIFALEEECPPRRIDAFCKLLDERCEYNRDEAGAAAKLRQQVFRAAAPLHPLVTEADPWFEHNEQATKQQIATSLGMSWEDIDNRLFADIIEFHRLNEFKAFEDPSALLSRYNVAQTQVALYDATHLTVWATADFKTVLRYAKLARLMHVIRRSSDGYRFDFSGPASLFTHTHRYGVAMAKFLPGLLSCRGWRLQASLRPPRWHGRIMLEFDEHCGLSSEVDPAAQFDSRLEEHFFERWGEEPREGWTLSRETEILHHGQTVFMPDFVLRHESGRSVMLEVVGFWTPEYLHQKQQTLAQFPDHRIVLALAEQHLQSFEVPTANTILFKTVIKVEAVLEKLRSLTF